MDKLNIEDIVDLSDNYLKDAFEAKIKQHSHDQLFDNKGFSDHL